MTLVVRDAVPADAEAWRAIREETAVEPETMTITEPGEDAPPEEWARRFLGAGQDAWFLVAVEHGRVVGILGLHRGERRASRHVADLGLNVAREHRGRGIGRALMLAAEARARRHGVRKLTLGVFPHNERALRLYRGLGYREEGLRRAQYVVRGEAFDEILMAKTLDER